MTAPVRLEVMRQQLRHLLVRGLWAFLLAATTTVVLANAAVAQEEWDPRRVYMTREQLQDLLGRLELTAESPAYSNALRERTRDEAELVRQRLQEGDFQVGDRILLTVENEAALTDTFTVHRGRVLSLPLLGEVSLAGLLRAELDSTLTEYVGRFIRDPRVRARSLIPVTIAGAVGQPGFYTVPSELRLTDALMMAGGTSPTAELTEIRIERGDEEIWDEEALQQAITEGRTLDQLSMRAGDLVHVPEGGPPMRTYEWIRVLGFALAIPATIAGLITIF